jgi:hypothetical protein
LARVASEERLSDFYAKKDVAGYDMMMEEIKSSNHQLLEFFPELEPRLRKYDYPL